ncbi:MAG: hypothetical protein KAT68_05570 [Bacteroidales bacterium]|nr:hypothetical protein [Bacteroidales bacterium]
MKRIIFIIIISFVYSQNVMSCKCKSYTLLQARKLNYENNELIFIGVGLGISQDTFFMNVIEVLKGEADSIIKGRITDCSFIPNKDEIWLVYTNFEKDSSIIIDGCSLSRSYNAPEGIIDYDIPPPPMPGHMPTKEFKYQMELLHLQALVDLNEEINLLRNTKNKRFIKQKEVFYKTKLNRYLIISISLFLIVLVISLLNITLLFKLKRRVRN